MGGHLGYFFPLHPALQSLATSQFCPNLIIFKKNSLPLALQLSIITTEVLTVPTTQFILITFVLWLSHMQKLSLIGHWYFLKDAWLQSISRSWPGGGINVASVGALGSTQNNSSFGLYLTQKCLQKFWQYNLAVSGYVGVYWNPYMEMWVCI